MKISVITLFVAARCSRVIEPVFWRVDNDLFGSEYTRHVQLQEKMDIFCPQYESAADEDSRTFSKSHHFQIIYLVDEESYNSCHLNVERAKKIMSCEQPIRVKKYTMKFQEVNPNPFGLEFHADTDYYFISTSIGDDIGGLTHREEGVCASHSMKMKVKVHRGDIEGVQRISEDYSDEVVHKPTVYDYRPYDEEPIDEPDDLPEDPSKEKQQELPNAIIVGVIVGTFLVILIVVAILLTRRVFENRKSSVSYPTLSDYQSSYVEKYDYPAYAANNVGGSPQTVYTQAFTPNMPNSPNSIVSLLPKYHQNHPMGTEKRLTEDFSYIDGSRLSNRTHEIVMV